MKVLALFKVRKGKERRMKVVIVAFVFKVLVGTVKSFFYFYFSAAGVLCFSRVGEKKEKELFKSGYSFF